MTLTVLKEFKLKEIQWEQSMRIKQFKLIIEELFEAIGVMENLTDRKYSDLEPETYNNIKETVSRMKGIITASTGL